QPAQPFCFRRGEHPSKKEAGRCIELEHGKEKPFASVEKSTKIAIAEWKC
ncbi:hypothetical protein AVEN_136292-1, partial [Araneus ventricosus]